MTDSTRLVLTQRAEKGKYVSFVHDVPDVPPDVLEIYSAFMELRHSTPSDEPIRFIDKIAAWEMFSVFSFETFSHFIVEMDAVFLKHMEKKREQDMNKRKRKA